MDRYPEYKDSSVAWIGEIPAHWEVKSLSQLARERSVSNKEVHNQNLLSLSYGKIVQKDINRTEGLLPASYDTYQVVVDGNIVLRLTDLQNDHKSLRVGLVTQTGIITSAYVALAPFEQVLATYLYSSLHTADIKKVFYGMGGGLRQNLSWGELRKLRMPFPPSPEQVAISSHLDSQLAKIQHYERERGRELSLLETLKKTEIAQVVTKGLNPDVPMRDSGIPWIGEIPAHWELKRLKSVLVDRNEPNAPVKTDFILSLTNDRGVIPYADKGAVGNKSKEDLTKYKLAYPDDIVLNSMNVHIGSVALSSYFGCISPVYYMLHVRNPMDSIRYYNYLFQTKELQTTLHRYGKGILDIRMRIQMSALNTVILPIPPPEEQQAIVDYLENRLQKIDTYIAAITEELEELRQYKQRLISDAVTGKIKVSTP